MQNGYAIFIPKKWWKGVNSIFKLWAFCWSA